MRFSRVRRICHTNGPCRHGNESLKFAEKIEHLLGNRFIDSFLIDGTKCGSELPFALGFCGFLGRMIRFTV